MEKQTTIDNSQPKLYSLFHHSDYAGRVETYRFKAFNVDEVINYIKANWFKPEAINDLNIEYSDEDLAYITWDGCDRRECAKMNNIFEDSEEYDFMCGDCETSQNSFEITLYENPKDSDFKFNTIEGTNNYTDLTQPKPVQVGKIGN